MSQEDAITEILASFELNKLESDTYVFLAKHGILKCREISAGLKRHTAQVYRALKTLQEKGLVESTVESPFRFSAVPFDKIIDLSIKIKHDEATAIEQERKRVLDYWKNFSQPSGQPQTERFVVIRGISQIYSRILQMMIETTDRFSSIVSIEGIVQAERFGIFDRAKNHPLRSKIEFRFLVEKSDETSVQNPALLKKLASMNPNMKFRKPDIEKSQPRTIIKDNDEMLFFVTPRDVKSQLGKDDVCLWTNCRALVQAFSGIFEDSWRNSTEINTSFMMRDRGDRVASDPEAISKRFEDAFSLAQERLVILTSANGLIELSQSKGKLNKAAKKGILVRIMAPIVKENLEIATQLSEICEIKHVSADYDVETLVIDDSVVLQLREKEVGSLDKVRNLVSSNNSQYIGMVGNSLGEIWNRCRFPSTFTLERMMPYGPSLFQFSESARAKFFGWPIVDLMPPNLVSEKAIADKCINAKKIVCEDLNKDVSRAYSSSGIALIHLQEYLDLPDMVIQCSKIDEQSSFGGENWLTVSLAGEDRMTNKYEIVASVGDNPNSTKLLEAIYSNINIQTLKKDEIQIRVHGNRLLAAWTVPIKLIPEKYALPPSCLIIEGYGQVKTAAFAINAPSGFKHEFEQNYFDAFVTFIHQESVYSGPSTDGCFCRDSIMTNYPPNIGR